MRKHSRKSGLHNYKHGQTPYLRRSRLSTLNTTIIPTPTRELRTQQPDTCSRQSWRVLHKPVSVKGSTTVKLKAWWDDAVGVDAPVALVVVVADVVHVDRVFDSG